TIVNMALAKLGLVFGMNVASVQWVVTAFSLASGIAMPAAAFMETRFTMKRVWILAVVFFTAGSAVCGIASAFWVLIAGRLLQGVAGGLLVPMALGALFRLFPEGERGGAFGLLAIPTVAGPAFGPTIGGYLVSYFSWRLVFFINLPIGLLAIVLAAVLLRSS